MVMLVLRRSVRRAATVGVYGTARPHPRLDIHSYGAPLVHFTPSLSSSRSPSAGSFSNDVVSSSFVHKRFMSSSSASSVSRDNEEEEDVTPEEPEQQPVLIYEGPMARAVRLMKGVSVTSCILTSIGMPTLCLISEQSASMVGKWAMCGTIMLFGLGTTSLFHVLFKPYVMRMWLNNNASSEGTKDHDPELTVETVTLFAQLTKHTFKLSDVAPPASSMHPMLSFQAKGKNLFIHPEVFEDRELAEKLIGKKIQPRPEEEDAE